MSVAEGEWSGRLVIRLLPQNVSGDYEAAKVANARRLQRPPSSSHVPRQVHHKTFEPVCMDEWRLSDCACVAMDMSANDGTTNEVTIHMNRSPSEVVDTALQRLGLSLAKKLLKKQKGEKSVAAVKYSLKGSDNIEIPHSAVTHFELWTRTFREDLEVQLSIDSIHIQLQVECCPPTLVTVKTFESFGSQVFVGIPLVVTTEALFTSHVVIDWFVGGELVLNDSRAYAPKAADVGKHVVVVLTPTRKDCSAPPDVYQYENEVRERPRNAVLDIRPNFSELRNRNGNLRVLSYNILADANAFSALATTLYPYCDDEIIRKERRLPLVLFEVLQYQADIICLQEVDHCVYHGLLKPVLEYHGYEGFFTSKHAGVEGPAMFWSLQVFEPLPDSDRRSHLIRDLFIKEHYLGDWSSIPDVFWLLDCHQDLNEMLRERLGHVLQTVTLTVRDNQRQIVVGNTHLFFHPMASHVRLLQLFVCLHQVEIERHGMFPVVFCGDLNSSPTSGAAKLLFDRVVPPSSGMTDQGTTWKHLHSFTWDREFKNPRPSNPSTPPTIRLPHSFPILCSGYPELPEFTHYLQRFAAALDYIMVSQDTLKPVAWAAMPSEDVLKENVAMPSVVLPSDHIALVCDLEWS